MSNEWVEMLKTHEIEPAEADTAIMARAKQYSQEVSQVVDLSGFAVVEISGEEAPVFLQGQFCNDLQQVSSTRAQITGYCTPKGRLLALPTIVGFESGFRLLVPQSVKEAFIKRLSMFVMRAKVSIRESSNIRCVGFIAADDDSVGCIQSLCDSVPVAPLEVSTSQSVQVIRWHDDHSVKRRARFLVIADNETVTNLWNQEGELVRSGQSAWRLADISAGVPSITGGVVEAFVPQMINLQLLDGLSFTKGCYPGQEIVARMHYLGKLKRHMRLFRLPLDAASLVTAPGPGSVPDLAPAAGSKLSCGTDLEAGVVVDAAQMGDDVVLILAVVKVSANQGTLQYENHDLVAGDLSYDLPSLISEQPDAV
ncbi:MAG: folate-binding protein YgfZ [Granulosicoccus sp.]|jgi:folate-binding protein YgfZ